MVESAGKWARFYITGKGSALKMTFSSSSPNHYTMPAVSGTGETLLEHLVAFYCVSLELGWQQELWAMTAGRAILVTKSATFLSVEVALRKQWGLPALEDPAEISLRMYGFPAQV